MTRVLHVLGELRYSGAEIALRSAGPRWSDFGVACDILSLGLVPGPFSTALEAAGYELHHIPFQKHPAFFLAYSRLLRDRRYDVVHVQMERAFVYLAVLGRLHGARVVRTVRNSYPFEGALATRRTRQRRLARAAGTRFVAISRSVEANEMCRFRNPTLLIENWIDEARFVPPTSEERQRARSELQVPSGAVAIATVGNCSDIKNHQALLKALSRFPDPRWVWLHVGEEDPVHSEQQLAEELDVAERCRFLGRTDPLRALHAADLFAMPSLWEGLGMATVEALSTGLPALLTEVDGNRDLVGLSDSLTWCAPDEMSLRDGLSRALAGLQPERASADSLKQHHLVAERFSLQAGMTAYVRLYSVK